MPESPNRYEQVDCKFRVSGKVPEFWNPLTGEISPVLNYKEENGYITIPIHLAPEGSIFVVFTSKPSREHVIRVDRNTFPIFFTDENRQYPPIAFEAEGNKLFAILYEPGHYQIYLSDNQKHSIESKMIPEEISLNSSWRVHFDPYWGKKGLVEFERLCSWTDFADPEIRYYSGKATYEKSFTLEEKQIKGKKILLNLGNVQELAVIRINDHTFPTSWSVPFEVDITPYVRKGKNELSIDVVNMWPNRLIGDGKLPKEERKTRTNIIKFDTADADKYLRISGLLGPVKIKFFEKVNLEE